MIALPRVLVLLVLPGCAEATLPPLAAECAANMTCAPPAGGAGGAAGASAFAGSGGATAAQGGSTAVTGGAGVAGAGGAVSLGGAGSGGAEAAPGGASPQVGGGETTSGGNQGSPLVVLSAGKPVSADSEEGGNSAASGNDGDAGTRWCAADAELGHHWTVDLGGVYALSSLELTFEFAGRQYGYVVEGSVDGADYQPLLDCTNNTKQTQAQSEPLNGSARYVRIRFVVLPPDTWASFYEARVMGT